MPNSQYSGKPGAVFSLTLLAIFTMELLPTSVCRRYSAGNSNKGELIMHRLVRFFPLIVAGVALALHGQTQIASNPEPRHVLTAEGTAVVSANADLAVIRAICKVFGPDAKTANASAADLANSIQHALASLGLPDGAVDFTSPVLQRSSTYDLQQYQMGTEERNRHQFTVTQSYTIRVKPDRAEAALKTAIDSGASEDAWVQWIVEDPSALEARANANALANAREAAVQMAQKIGIRLGDLVGVTVRQFPVNYGGCCSSAAAYGMGDSVVTTSSNYGGASTLVYNSQRVEFKVSVSATFLIEEAPAKSK
jgi:uncharacterized protein YggE